MTLSEKKAKQKKELHQKIFFSAVQLIQQKGVDEFSIRKLAKEIDYSTRTIYLHFENKYDLFNKIIDKAFEGTLKKYLAVDKMRNGSNSMEIIKAKIDLHIETAIENPVFYQSVIKIIQSNEFVMGDNQKAVIQNFMTDTMELLKDKYEEEAIKIRLQLAMSFLQSATVMLISKKELLDQKDEYISTVFDSIFKGILN